jgi:hypothetical protein
VTDKHAPCSYCGGDHRDPKDRIIADLLAALRPILDLDDGDFPALWPHAALFEAGREAVAAAEARS